MNEIFAAEPTCFHSYTELRELLRQFGPDTGRYLAAYPTLLSWPKIVIKNMLKHVGDVVLAGEVGPVEEKKITVLLQRALEEHRVIPGDGMPYVWNDKPWLYHALKLIPPSGHDLTAIVAAQNVGKANVFTLENLNIPPVAEEKMKAQPREFVRVVKTLVSISNELVFVDPYADPCNDDVYVVLLAIFKIIAASDCNSVIIYARENMLLKKRTLSELQVKILSLRKESALPNRCKFELRLFNDSTSQEKVHARYIFSKRGGVRFDQGFLNLGKGKIVDVGPIAPAILKHAIQCFIESKHDMGVRDPLKA